MGELLHKHPNLGVLATPKSWNALPPVGTVWAADNSAFGGFDEAGFRSFLERLEERRDCLWVSAPDVVGDARATLDLWPAWAWTIRHHGQRPALVAQNGLTLRRVHWDEVGALFLGGAPECVPCAYVRPIAEVDRETCPTCGRPLTEWKESRPAIELVAEANRRGLWTHMGRVNTADRILFAAAIGCRSVDGSSFSKWSRTHIPWAVRVARQIPLGTVSS